MKINIAIFVAPNSEDIETIVPIDLLRQAKLNIKVISLDKSKTLKLANGTQIICDSLINNEVLTKYNVFVFPGGSGILQVNNKKLSDFCYANANNKKYLFCANCVAPTKLFEWGMFEKNNIKLTCYPASNFTKKLLDHYVNKRVVVNKNFISAAGPGCSSDFTFAIINKLLGVNKTKQIKKSTVFN